MRCAETSGDTGFLQGPNMCKNKADFQSTALVPAWLLGGDKDTSTCGGGYWDGSFREVTVRGPSVRGITTVVCTTVLVLVVVPREENLYPH